MFWFARFNFTLQKQISIILYRLCFKIQIIKFKNNKLKEYKMALSIGIVGLPNVGKSTLFNALTNGKAEAANYPFCTIDKNEALSIIYDERIDKLSQMMNSKKKIYNTTMFVDIAGLVKGASKGEGLGNKFLSHIREANAILQVVRVFEDDNITHIGAIDPLRDIEIILTELMLADMETITARITKNTRSLKGVKSKSVEEETALLEKLSKDLDNGKPIFSLPLTDGEKLIIRPLFLLTAKEMMIAANLSEGELADPTKNKHFVILSEYAKENNIELIPFSAKIEAELQELDEEERLSYLSDIGVSESGVSRLAKAGHKLLNLITYITAGEQETRAWTVRSGALGPEAAGVIHSDFERGFISAEVITYENLLEVGSLVKAKEKGLVRLEGKQYEVQEGDVILFRFNV